MDDHYFHAKQAVKKKLQLLSFSKLFIFFLPRSNKIALTFDDGPNQKYTEKFIDILAKENVKSTFFVVGERAEGNPHLVQRIHEAGHCVASHGFTHRTLKGMSCNTIESELLRGQKSLYDILGETSPFYRPPRGLIDFNVMKMSIKCKLKMMMWTHSSRDSGGIAKDNVIENLKLHALTGGEILLMHDNNKETLAALPIIIKEIRKKKFEFTVLSAK